MKFIRRGSPAIVVIVLVSVVVIQYALWVGHLPHLEGIVAGVAVMALAIWNAWDVVEEWLVGDRR